MTIRNQIVTETNWTSTYTAKHQDASSPGGRLEILRITQRPGVPNAYEMVTPLGTGWSNPQAAAQRWVSHSRVTPFAGSDFWALADLGLEFLYWPEQRLIKKEIRRGQSCDVLESINPHHSSRHLFAGGFLDRHRFGRNHQRHGVRSCRPDKPLKEFATKSVNKVQGRVATGGNRDGAIARPGRERGLSLISIENRRAGFPACRFWRLSSRQFRNTGLKVP